MGNHKKQKWRKEEEEALLAGVEKHGPGKWKNILNDPAFSPFLSLRSNIDLKDKWRNLSVNSSGLGSRDKSRAAKLRALTLNSLPTNTTVDDNSNSELDGRNGQWYNAMIFEALSTTKDSDGGDISAILHFIQQRHKVPPNFRRLLSSRLRRLVSQGKLDKVQNSYRLKRDSLFGIRAPMSQQKEVRPWQLQDNGLVSSEAVEAAAAFAAYKVAEAENKSFLAVEAVKEAESLSNIAEYTEAMVILVKELCEQCMESYRVRFKSSHFLFLESPTKQSLFFCFAGSHGVVNLA